MLTAASIGDACGTEYLTRWRSTSENETAHAAQLREYHGRQGVTLGRRENETLPGPAEGFGTINGATDAKIGDT